MRHGLTGSILMAGALMLVTACDSAREPTAPPPASPNFSLSSHSSLDNQIERLIPQLFPRSILLAAAFIRFEAIEYLVKRGRSKDAQKQALAFVAMAFQRYKNHQLIGDQSDGTQSKLRSFVDLLYQFVGLGSAPIPSDALGPDGAVAIVGPEGSTVVTETEFAGAAIPPGAFSSNVIVVINKDPDQEHPLPTAFGQFPLFYDLQTFPAVPQTGQEVVVGVCVDDGNFPGGVPPTTLRLAHTSHVDPTTIEFLPLAEATFLNCPESFGARRGVLPMLAGAGRTVARDLFWLVMGAPRDLSASTTRRTMRPGGLGGRTGSFSPFGAVVFDSVLVPYGAAGYRYKVVDSTVSGGEFEQPTFNDTTAEFTDGDAAFGSGSVPGTVCPLDPTVHTTTPVSKDILLRKTFVVPGGVGNVHVKVAIDNDVQVFVNGTDVTASAGSAHLVNGFQRHDGCATQGSFIFTVPAASIHTGTNLVTVRARDRGVVSYVDIQVTAQLLE